MVSGDADEMWPASEMSDAIIERRRSHGVGPEDPAAAIRRRGPLHPPADHPDDDPLGAPISCRAARPRETPTAQAAAWTARLEFLAQHLGSPPN
jgi:hypothetical protein